ncbi:MAG: hypothetical protein A3G81_14695 [Betaproteobacteria bacterium RIFCSPLOWO2_12_FULL_65_14]|nr:MAG: hypothetical protein A3G81_14695 [Betaproteobacteria bacterium RIFCSPLOWO2_12_FULL_65_14]
MSNGKPATARAIFLAACMLASGGCGIGAAPSQQTNIASLAPEPRAPEARYQVDAARNRIWVLTDDGVVLYDVKTPKKIAIPLPDWVLVGKTYGCLPDLALGPKGEAVVTSNVVPTLWRIDPETLAVSVHPLALDADTDKDVGFSGLAYSAEHGAFFAVSGAHGTLWRIDPLFTRARKIGLPEPIRNACWLGTRPRGQQSIQRPAGLCVRTPEEVWDLHFAPSQRSAYIIPGGDGSCGIG